MSSSWTPDPLFCGKGRLFKGLRQSAIVALCVLLCAGCGRIGSPRHGDSPQNPEQIPAESSKTGESISPLIAPPGSGNRPPAPGTTGLQKNADGLPILQPPRGVNTKALFAEEIRDTDHRMTRLENAVQEIRNDFDAISPSIIRLVAIEQDIQDLVGQLEILLKEEPVPEANSAPIPAVANAEPLPLGQPAKTEPAIPAAVPPAPTAVPAPSATPPVPAGQAAPHTPLPQAGVGSSQVLDLRIGEHAEKTRIVLDTSTAVAYSTDLDNDEKLLLVELPEAKWNAPSTKSFGNSPMLESYRTEPLNDGQGTLLVLQLRHPARILFKGSMAATSGNGKRIVIDVGGL